MPPSTPRASRPLAPRRRDALRATIVCVAVLQLVSAGLSQGSDAEPATAAPPATAQDAPDADAPRTIASETPTVAIHYEDVLSTEPGAITIFFPRPAGNDWRVLQPVSDDPCLRVGRVSGSEPGQVLVIEADVFATAAPDGAVAGPRGGASDDDSADDARDDAPDDLVAAAGLSRCHAKITLTFATPTERWSAAAAVIVNRLDAPELPYTDLAAVMTSDDIAIPRLGAPVPAQPASLLTLTLRNPFEHAITIRGVADPGRFEDLVGTIHPHDPAAFDGTYATLEAISQRKHAVMVEAGADIAFALLLDPERRLADGTGTLTIRPALVVERGGTTFASPFPRVSMAWGNDLP